MGFLTDPGRRGPKRYLKTKLLALLLLPVLALVLVMPVFAPDVPYSFVPFNPPDCRNATWDGINSNPSSSGNANAEGVQDTDFTGKTITSIGIYLCAFSQPCTLTADSSLATIGIFDATNGALVASFGTVSWDALPQANSGVCAPDHNPNSAEITVTGSHVLLANEMVGITFNSATTGHWVAGMCADPCAGTEIPDGTTITISHASTPTSNAGFALAGDFVFGSTPAPSHTALYMQFAPVFAVMVLGMGILSLKKSKAGLIVVAIGIVILIAFLGPILNVWT
jgi:hypothetical protein